MADAKPFAGVAAPTLKEIAQSLMTMKAQATSLENSAEAFMPLTDHTLTLEQLTIISEAAETIRKQVNVLYRAIAREAAAV